MELAKGLVHLPGPDQCGDPALCFARQRPYYGTPV